MAFAGTGPESVEEAARALAAAGIEARGHVGIERLVAGERLDALAVLSPHETHRVALAAALEAGLHVLCEKPFVWGGSDVVGETRRFVDGFAARALVLREHCQWPWALPAFESLHPGALDQGIRRFAMRLSPGERGAAMLVDALPHPLSIVQALAGADGSGAAEEIGFPEVDDEGRRVRIVARWVNRSSAIDVDVELVGGQHPPREVWLEIDGRRARRLVDASDWSFRFEGEGRSVAVPDPTALGIRDFVRSVERARYGERPPRASAIVARMEALAAVVAAYGRATSLRAGVAASRGVQT
ncbi:hypothetical protein MYXO_00243 [Myxococcaceae bacterium]|nr:hypothetical protein MYXO_00243 [Myxococcaceae bacterium]